MNEEGPGNSGAFFVRNGYYHKPCTAASNSAKVVGLKVIAWSIPAVTTVLVMELE